MQADSILLRFSYRDKSQKKDTADETYMVETAVCPM